MRLAVVGDDPAALSLLEAIAASSDHELIAFALAPTLSAQLRAAAPGARVVRTWEELLADRQVEGVIVAGADDESLRAARQLAAASKPLLVAPAVAQAATFAYELTLLKDEQPVVILPMLGLRGHPLAGRLRQKPLSDLIGSIQHVRLERQIVAEGSLPLVSPSQIAAAFVADADLLRSLWGDYDQVTAVRSGDPAGMASLVSVTLAGRNVPQVVWSATAGAATSWRLAVTGQHGTATLEGDPDSGSLAFETSVGEKTNARESMEFDASGWLLARFSDEVAQGKAGARGEAPRVPGAPRTPDWEDFTRVVDLLDALERSIRRRRTIELFFETPSERGQFKTQMTAAGCSLLMLTLVASVAYLTTAALIDLGPRVKQILVALIFLPLGLFLLLQGLVFIARPSSESERH